MRDYGKVFSTFWTSATTRSLSEDGRALALYLITSPHTNMIGVFRLPDGYVCEDLQWSSERVSKGFQNCLVNGFATRSEPSKWVVIHKHLVWNPVDNPNQAKAALKLAEAIPLDLPSRPDVARLLVDSCARFRDKLPPDIWNRFETLSKPVTGTGAGTVSGTGAVTGAVPLPEEKFSTEYVDTETGEIAEGWK